MTRNLLPFAVILAAIAYGLNLQGQSQELYGQCIRSGQSADSCALRIYGR